MQRVLKQNIGVGIFVHLPTRQKRRLLIEVPKPVQTTGGWCNAKPDPKNLPEAIHLFAWCRVYGNGCTETGN